MPVLIPVAGYAVVAIGGYTGLTAAAITIASAVAYGVISSEQARRQQKKAFEASRRDNVTMVRSAEQPHRWVYGEARVSGPIVFTHTAGTENGYLYIAVTFTGHEVADIIEILFNETNIGVTEGDVLLGSSYFQGSLKIFTHELEGQAGTIQTANTVGEFSAALDGSLNIYIPLTGTLASVIAVQNAAEQSSGGFEFFGAQPLAYTISGGTVTITEPGAFVGMLVTVFWTEWVGAPLVNVKSYLGTPDQLADQMLMDETGGRWTSAHRLRGRSYVRARLFWTYQKFLTGIPNLSARVRGWKLPDIRGTTDVDEFSSNPALVIRHYIKSAWGVTDDEIDDDSFVTAANICDEFIIVNTGDISDPVQAINWFDYLNQAVADGTWEEIGGVPVNLASTDGLTVTNGTLAVDSTTFAEPALLVGNTTTANSAYVTVPPVPTITDGRIRVRMGYPGALNAVGFTFRASNIGAGDSFDGYRIDLNGTGNELRLFENHVGPSLTPLYVVGVPHLGATTIVTVEVRLDGSNIAIYYNDVFMTNVINGAFSSGTFRLLAYRNPTLAQMWFFDVLTTGPASGTTFRQRRYACNGSFTVDRTREDILQGLLSSCAGMMAVTGGQWRLIAGAYVTPTLTLTNDDLRGPITIVPKKALRDVFNTVRGVYAGKGTFDQPTDFPPVTGSDFQAEDGGEIPTNIELEFTNESVMAQRISLIHLRRHRSAISVQMPCKLGQALALRPGDTVMLTFSDLAWSEKVFRIEGWSIRCDEDWGIDLVLQEDNPDNYDWTINDSSINGLPAITGITSDDMISDDIASDEFLSDEALSDELDTDAS